MAPTGIRPAARLRRVTVVALLAGVLAIACSGLAATSGSGASASATGSATLSATPSAATTPTSAPTKGPATQTLTLAGEGAGGAVTFANA